MLVTGSAPRSQLRVLLISPVRGVDPNSGDVTYTEQLLASPPPGVEYTLYPDAIAAGTLRERGSRMSVRVARGPALGPELGFAAWRKAETLVRRTGLAYRERLRIFSVDPGAFDLVHVHVFHTRFVGEHPPVLMSAAGPLGWVYGDAWGWSPRRRAVAEHVDRVIGHVMDGTMCATRPGRASRHVAFSEYQRTWMEARGFPATSIDVVPNYLALELPEPLRTADVRGPTRLGFVAKDFRAKGGEVLLAAFAALRARHPYLTLTVVGSPPTKPDGELAALGVRWLPFVPREELLSTLLPTFDLMVYPSLFDGLPYGPMEVLAYGIPAVVSDYRALPELIGAHAGRVSRTGDPASLAAAVEELLDPDAWAAASAAARQRFHQRFSATTQREALGASYRATVTQGKTPRG